MRLFRVLTLTFLIISAFIPFSTSGAFDLAGHVTEFQLKNGMRWLIVRREQAPVFSGIVMVRAGGVDEREGKTGVAHMFEHMAFKGSSRICTKDWAKEQPILAKIEALGAEMTAEAAKGAEGTKRAAVIRREMAQLSKQASAYQEKNEVWDILMRNGAKDINAYTSKDITAFFASLPSNRLGLWAAVTADMVFDPAYRDFYTERSVVAEERRSGVDDNPDGAFVEQLLKTAFQKGGYSWSTIGYQADVMGLTIGDAREFHRQYYVPSNMVGVIVGDVNAASARAVLEREFGRFPRGRRPPEPIQGQKPAGGIEETFSFAAGPAVAVAFHKPTLPDPAEYSFDVITSLLCEGSSSRLKKRLVFDEHLANNVFCSDGFPGSRMPNLFIVWIEPMKGRTVKKILEVLEEEIEQLRTTPLSEEELARVRKNVTASIMLSLDVNDTFAEQLARFETLFGDWRLLGKYPEMIGRVSPDDVMEVANRYLVDSNRVVLERKRGR